MIENEIMGAHAHLNVELTNMNKKKRHVISKILPGSIAEELELSTGDILVSVNDQPVEDVFDYRYLMNE